MSTQDHANNVIINGGDSDVAKSIMTNTLLNSMKTNQPLIDTITSLVFISNFKNPLVKNISIILVLLIGIIFHRITKSIDILSNIYEYLISYYDIKHIINYIPSATIRNKLLKINGNTISLKIDNREDWDNIKAQYTLLSMWYKIIEKYPDTPREIIERCDMLGASPRPSNDNILNRLQNNQNCLIFNDYEGKNENISTYLENIIISPPKMGQWFLIEDNVYVNYTLVKFQVPSQSSTQSTQGSQPTQGSQSVQTSYYILKLKSYTKTNHELYKYTNDTRKVIINKITNHETEVYTEKNRIMNQLKSKDFIGHIYEVRAYLPKDSLSKKPETEKNELKYTLTAINKFCRPLQSIFFKEKEKLIDLLYNFKQKTGIYEKLPHRYKIGILIYGSPGSGKTSLAVAIATELKRYIVRVSLKDKDLDDDKLSFILNTYTKDYVIILDELDTHKAFRPRKNKELDESSVVFDVNEKNEIDEENEIDEATGTIMSKDFTESKYERHQGKKINIKRLFNIEDKLTIGPFLESMDGISSTEGRVVIAMTNHPKLLDPAIIRPGRFDIAINMDSLELEYMILYMKYVFEGFCVEYEEIKDACEYAHQNKVSTSILEQACIEKYSTRDKPLKECVKNVHDSFVVIH